MIVIDTEAVSVSDAVVLISKQVEITDISVAGASAEEMVVSLYRGV